MHKVTRKLAALLAVLVLAVGALFTATPAFAAGNDGNITVTSTNPEFKNKTITVYQMFNETGTAGSKQYVLVEAWEDFFTTSNGQGGIGLTDGDKLSDAAYTYIKGLNETELASFAKKASDWAKEASHLIVGKTSASGATLQGGEYSVTVDQLAYGYYVVSPQTGSTPAADGTYANRGTDAMLVNVNSAEGATQELKSVYPTPEKTVQTEDGDADDHASASVGDTLTFTLTAKVPDTTEYTDYYQFAFVDTLSDGLTFNKITSVKIGETPLDTPADYTVTKTPTVGNRELRIDFGTKQNAENTDIYNAKTLFSNKVGQTITVTYTATLNENAEVASDETNSVHIDYSNNPGHVGTGSSGDTETHQYTFKFDLNKTDGTNGLAGAQFQLKDSEGNVIDLISAGTDTYRPIKTGETGVADGTVTTPEGGVIHFTGLAAGTYILHEVKAPDGYNTAADTTVTIDAQYNDDGTLNSWSVKVDNQEQAGQAVEVENHAGTILPGTGGIGTVVFTVAGIVLVVAGVAWAMRRRQRD